MLVVPREKTPKNLPAMQQTQVQSLGQEDPLEKEMAPHSNILAWKIPWTEEPSRLQSMGSSILAWRIPGTGEPCGLLSMGSHRVRHDCGP